MTPRKPSEYATVEWYGHRWEFSRVAERIKNASVLELGCGEGYFARCLPASTKYWGVDFNESAINVASAVVGRETIRFSPNLPDLPGAVDWLCMFHVVEHIPSLASELASLLQRYQPKNVAVSVPNEQRLTVSCGCRETWDFPPHHLYRFSKTGVVKLFGNLGYRLVFFGNEPLRKCEVRDALGLGLGWSKSLVDLAEKCVGVLPEIIRPRLGQASLFIFEAQRP
mgnify:CR=1 FL=1